jgi:hypothetical protein
VKDGDLGKNAGSRWATMRVASALALSAIVIWKVKANSRRRWL